MKLALSVATILALTLAGRAEAGRFQRQAVISGPSLIELAFGGEPAVRLELAAVRGDLHRMGGPEPRLLDFADYSQAGTLSVFRTLAVGPLPDGPALVPPGEYAVSIQVSGPEGLPVLNLASSGGLRLRIPMVAAPRPASRPEVLSAVSLGDATDAVVSIPLAIHLPTVSGLLLIGPLDTLQESPLQRRLSRSDVIRQEMERRALETGRVRNMERRQARPDRP